MTTATTEAEKTSGVLPSMSRLTNPTGITVPGASMAARTEPDGLGGKLPPVKPGAIAAPKPAAASTSAIGSSDEKNSGSKTEPDLTLAEVARRRANKGQAFSVIRREDVSDGEYADAKKEIETKKAMVDLIQSLQDALAFGKEASMEIEVLRKQLAEKEAQLAGKDAIILEKVAAAAKNATITPMSPVSPALVTQLVDSLADRRFLQPQDKQAYLQGLQANPDNLVKLANRLLTISIPSPAQGRGIGGQTSKQASASFIDEGWDIVVEQGA